MSGDGAVVVCGLFTALAVVVALTRPERGVVAVLGPPGAGHDGVPWRLAAAVRARRRTGPGGEVARVRVLVAQVQALLRAGAPPGAAWSRAAGVPVDDVGVPDVRALAALVGDAPAHAVCAATRLALSVGAPLGRVLDTVADALVAAAESDAERQAALAGPRATARLLLWLPAAGGLLGWALGADPVTTASDGAVGTAAVGGGLVLLAVGRWWTGRLVDVARRAGAPA